MQISQLFLQLSQTEKLIINILKNIYREGNQKDAQIFIHGGYLRDQLLKIKTNDIDLLVSQELIDFLIEKLQLDLSVRKIPFRFRMTILSQFPKKGQTYYWFKIEKIQLGIISLNQSINCELDQKDFTINALCYDIIKDVLIPTNHSKQAINDIFKRRLQCTISIQKTFQQSPSRVFRLLRFSLIKGFSINKEMIYYLKEKRYSEQILENGSVWCQMRKLMNVLVYYDEMVLKIFKYIYLFNLGSLINYQICYEQKCLYIMFFKCQCQNGLVRGRDFQKFDMPLRDLAEIHLLNINKQ